MSQDFARQLIGVAFLAFGALVMFLLWKIRGPIYVSDVAARLGEDDDEASSWGSKPRPPVVLDANPDEPVAFGYSIAWLALRASDTQHVARVVGLTSPQPANWETGLESAFRGHHVFVSPPVAGWIFVAGLRGLAPSAHALPAWELWMHQIAAEFSEVHYFASHRESNFHAWARYVDGRELRAYSSAGDVDRGTPATAEQPSRQTGGGGTGAGTPDEELILRIAAEWGFNPMTLEDRDYPHGVGLVGLLDSKDFDDASAWPRSMV